MSWVVEIPWVVICGLSADSSYHFPTVHLFKAQTDDYRFYIGAISLEMASLILKDDNTLIVDGIQIRFVNAKAGSHVDKKYRDELPVIKRKRPVFGSPHYVLASDFPAYRTKLPLAICLRNWKIVDHRGTNAFDGFHDVRKMIMGDANQW